MSYAQDRIKRLRKAMLNEGIDVLFIRNLSNIKWASALDGVFDDEDAHALIVFPERMILHTDSRYAQAAEDAAKDTDVVVDASVQAHVTLLANLLVERSGAKTQLANKHDSESQHARKQNAEKQGSFVLGIESDITLGEYRQLEIAFAKEEITCTIKETKAFVREIRAIKDYEEIRRMRAAQAITDAAYKHILKFIRPGATERAIQIELEDFMLRHGASGLAFSSIVASGANGANPHAIPGNNKLEAGQSLVLDFGARAFGYCSDMTRTVFLGEPSRKMREAYQALQEANERVESFLRVGVTGAQAQDLAESILATAGFAKTMGHSLGHGVGIDIHEEPVLASRNDRPLEVGNVVTVEPGIYFAHEFGMRLEDFGVITENGFDVFTQSSHDMVII